jgi:hypothetical protein
MQPTGRYITQFIYFDKKKMLYMFQAVPLPIIRSSHCTSAPDDGQGNRLKHVEHFLFIEINKLSNVASCWLHFGIILKIHGLMNIKYIEDTWSYEYQIY